MSELGDRFLIGRGAPFHELQRQLGLLADDRRNLPLRAGIFMGLTAAVPLLIALATAGGGSFLAMLTHAGFLTRFVLFIAICFLMENNVEQQLRKLLVTLGRSGLLTDQGRAQGAHAVTAALKRRDSALAEGVCIALAVAICVYSGATHHGQSASAWLYAGTGGQGHPTPAGWWVLTVSNGLFWFLFLRWIWRITIWGMLLNRLARLDLRLVATHPDGYGGMGFLTASPNVFAPLVFAISAVVAATLYRQLAGGTIGPRIYGQLMAAWLALVLIAFSLPLLAFRTPLNELRDRTLIRSDRLATRIERAKERHVFGENVVAPARREDGREDGRESEEPHDPAAFRKAATALSTMPISRQALVPLGAAALIPLLLVGATQLPLKELLKAAKALIIL